MPNTRTRDARRRASRWYRADQDYRAWLKRWYGAVEAAKLTPRLIVLAAATTLPLIALAEAFERRRLAEEAP